MDTLLQPEAFKYIANLCGVELQDEFNDDTEKENEKTCKEPEKETIESDKTIYNIRKGREDDVLKDKRSLENYHEYPTSSSISDYTYEEFQKEFLDEKTNEDLYDDDSRITAEYDVQGGGTYEAGKVLDQEYLVVSICSEVTNLKIPLSV